MKRILSLLLCCMLLLAVLPLTANAEPRVEVSQYWDTSAYVGGIMDMYAWVGEEDPDSFSYQWQVDLSLGDGTSWSDLADSDGLYGYHGTNTDHFQFITKPQDNTYEVGTDWELIPFRCRVERDGEAYYTCTMYMHLYSYSDCVNALERKGFGLYEPNLDGAGSLVTSDYITYSATAPAGTMLTANAGCRQPHVNEDDTLFRSEISFVPEVWITENGETVYNDYTTSYMPYTIGENAVTVQYRLRYKIGINDMGYYETKTVHLTTTEPKAIGTGTVKQEIPLYRQMYTQARKLTYIPKGAQIPVVESIGGTWYKVCWDGFVGFVPAGSIEVKYEDTEPEIRQLELELEDPLVGNTPSFTAAVNTTGCALYRDEPVVWYDQTEERFLSENDVFEDGHAYSAHIYVSAQSGYRFAVDPYGVIQTQARLNGLPVPLQKPYEMDPEKTLELVCDYATLIQLHQCALTYVPPVEATCIALGHEGYYRCECGSCYADAEGKEPINAHLWGQIPVTGHTPGEWICDTQYHTRQCAVCGEVIPGSGGVHTGSGATCQQSAVCTQCGVEFGQKHSHVWMPFYEYAEQAGHAHLCEEPLCTEHDQLQPHTPGPEATATEPQLCLDCGYILVPARGAEHKHQLTQVAATEATCTQSGSKAYYTCSGCSGWFADSAGSIPINSPDQVLLPALGHFTGDWESDGTSHWQSCRICGKVMDFVRGFHTDGDDNGACDVCGCEQITVLTVIDTDEEPPAGRKATFMQLSVKKGSTEPTEEPPQIEPGTQTVFVPAQTEATEPAVHPAEQPLQEAKQNGWPVAVLLGAVCFGAAIVTTVIVMKKRR